MPDHSQAPAAAVNKPATTKNFPRSFTGQILNENSLFSTGYALPDAGKAIDRKRLRTAYWPNSLMRGFRAARWTGAAVLS